VSIGTSTGLSRQGRLWLALPLTLALLLAAQLVSWWIVAGLRLDVRGHVDLPGPIDLTFVNNTGVSFGILNGRGTMARNFVTLIGLLSTAFIIGFMKDAPRLRMIAVSFIAAGALSNLCDRLSVGYVVDYFDASRLWFPWVFNMADVLINVGAGLMIIDLVRYRGSEHRSLRGRGAAPLSRPGHNG
jgi:signal peptidase II